MASLDKKPTTMPQQIMRLQLQKAIGEGTYGRVHLGRSPRSGDAVAVKEVPKRSKRHTISARNEASIMSQLDHEHIVKIRGEIETDDRIYIVMDYAQGGDLLEEILAAGALSEPEARRIFAQLVLAVEHLHKHQVVHRDLKPENVFLDENKNVRLGDYGMSMHYDPARTPREVSGGTLEYTSPEALIGIKVHGPELDVWSLGVILHVMFSGEYPFWASTPRSLSSAIITEPTPELASMPTGAHDLMRLMLKKHPKDRITIDDIKMHSWVREEIERQSGVKRKKMLTKLRHISPGSRNLISLARPTTPDGQLEAGETPLSPRVIEGKISRGTP